MENLACPVPLGVSVLDQGILGFGTLQTQQRPGSASSNSLLDADSWGEAQRQSLVRAGYNKGRTNVCEYQSISLLGVTFAIFSSGLLDMLVESCFLSHCWKNFTWQMWCDSSCDWQQLPEIVAKNLVGICLGLRERKVWGRKDSVASSVVIGQALLSQTPGTQLGGGCWGVHFDSLSQNGCLLLLAGFPVISQSCQTLEFVCISAYLVGGVGRLLVSEALVVFEFNFLP